MSAPPLRSSARARFLGCALGSCLVASAATSSAETEAVPHAEPPRDLAGPKGDEPATARARYGFEDRLGWAVPDYVKIQTGGFLGAFTGVVGYSIWKDRFNVGVQYGFTPRWEGAPAVHLFAGTVTVRPVRIDIGPSLFVVPLYVGGGALVAKGANLFVEQPAVYPAGYYAPTAVQLLALFGIEIGARSHVGDTLTRQSVFAEVVTINQYIDAVIDNRSFRLANAFSTAAGYRASF